MKLIAAALAFLIAMAWVVASANDSTAILRAGDLQLTFNPDITMASEELFVSAEEIRVAYRFQNTAARDIATTVAFPLPEFEVGGDTQYDVENGSQENFLNFAASAGGKVLSPKLQLRATRFGVDRTSLLAKRGLPVLPFGDLFSRLEQLDERSRRVLDDAGLVDWHTSFGAQNKALPNPHWIAHATFYWQQRFAAGKSLEVSHRYRPVAGVSFFGEHTVTDPELRRAYCMDDGFLRAARKLLAAGGGAMVREIHYVLTTANNWRGSIGQFKLIVDKGAPDNLVSLCRDGIKKTGATTFQFEAQKFVPKSDLKVLIIEPAAQNSAG